MILYFYFYVLIYFELPVSLCQCCDSKNIKMESSKLFAANSKRFFCETFHLLLLGFVYFLFPVLSSNLSYLCVIVSLCLLSKTSSRQSLNSVRKSRQSLNSVRTWGRPWTQDPLAPLQVLRLKVCNTLPRHHVVSFSFFRYMYMGVGGCGGVGGYGWVSLLGLFCDLSSTYFSKTGFLSQTHSWPT